MSTLNKAQVRSLLADITGTEFTEGFRANLAYLIAMKIPASSIESLESVYEEMTVRVCQTLIEFTSIDTSDIEGVVEEVKAFLKWRSAIATGSILSSYDVKDEDPCSRISAVDKFVSNSTLSYITNVGSIDLNKIKVFGELINLELGTVAGLDKETEEGDDE